MLSRPATRTRWSKDSMREPNDIDKDPRFILKHIYYISIFLKLYHVEK